MKALQPHVWKRENDQTRIVKCDYFSLTASEILFSWQVGLMLEPTSQTCKVPNFICLVGAAATAAQ
jgi:hypothetical protein